MAILVAKYSAQIKNLRSLFVLYSMIIKKYLHVRVSLWVVLGKCTLFQIVQMQFVPFNKYIIFIHFWQLELSGQKQNGTTLYVLDLCVTNKAKLPPSGICLEASSCNLLAINFHSVSDCKFYLPIIILLTSFIFNSIYYFF